MAKFRFSRRAEKDLLLIGVYTLETCGEIQAIHYIEELENCCQNLADSPGLGRACDYIRPGLRRMEYGSHVVFYRQESEDILVSRILHRRMVPDERTIDDGTYES